MVLLFGWLGFSETTAIIGAVTGAVVAVARPVCRTLVDGLAVVRALKETKPAERAEIIEKLTQFREAGRPHSDETSSGKPTDTAATASKPLTKSERHSKRTSRKSKRKPTRDNDGR